MPNTHTDREYAWVPLARSNVGALPAVLLLCVACAPSASAARPPAITGTVSEPGMTVIAVGTSGRATTVRATTGTFRIRPPARRVSLHLRRASGRYAGPIVIATARRGRRTIMGVRAGTRLGRITAAGSTGRARVARAPARRRLDASLWARARGGVPIGARVFGHVRSRPARDPVAGDHDADGVPDPLDIDDDGDLILDNLERGRRARAAQVVGFDTELHLRNVLPVGINGTTNANAGTTTAQSDTVLSEVGYLIVSEMAGDTAELDCGLLGYCRLGGTGTVFGTDPPLEFPECCDPDRDGLGAIARNPSLPTPAAGMFLRHGATTSAIKTGDVLIERVTTGGVETAYPATLQYVFATVPALASFRDTAAQPHAEAITYPVPFGRQGSPGNGFPVAAGSDGDVVLHVSLWRPQRRHIDGDAGTGEWTDIGGLAYLVFPQTPQAPGLMCPQDSLTEPSGELALPAPGQIALRDQSGHTAGAFIDRSADRAPDVRNVVSFTLNMSRCLGARGASWPVDQEIGIAFRALAGNGTDAAEQVVHFRRVA
jgi:hypothetical protein